MQTSDDIVRTIPSGLFIYRYEAPNSLFLLYGNPEAERLTGIKVADCIGKEFNEIWPGAKEWGLTDAFLGPMKTGKVYQTEDLYYKDDKHEGSVRARAFRLPGDKLAVAFENLTEIRKAELTVRKSEEKYRSLVANIPDVVWTADQNGNTTFVSQNVEDVCGYNPEEIYTGQNHFWFGKIHPDDVERVTDAEARLFGEETPLDVEYRIQRKDGEWIWLQDRSIGTYDKDGVKYADGVFSDITERKKAEQELHRSEQMFRTYFELGLVGMAVTSPEKGWVYVNDNLCKMLGYSRDELKQTTWADLTHPEDLEADVSQFEQVLEGKINSYSMDKRFIRKDGEIVYTNLSLACVRREDGSVEYFIAHLHDITDRKEDKAALQESENRYRTVVENAGEGIVVTQDGNPQFINPHFMDITGYSEEEFMSRPFIEFVHPDDRELVMGLHIKRLKGEEVSPVYEFRAIHKQGHTMWLENNGILIEWGGRPASLNFLRDITDRKKTEEALRKSEERLKILFESAPDAYYIHDLEGKFVDGNRAAEELLGYQKEEAVGESFFEMGMVTEADVPKSMAAMTDNIDGKPAGPLELTLNHKDGSKVMVETRSYPVDIAGETLILGIARDITERKEAEQKVKSSEERFKVLFEYAPDAYYMTDLQGKFVDGNRAAEQTIGYNREELNGKSFLKLKLLSLGQIPKAAKLLARNVLGQPTGPDEFVLNRKDGTKVDVEIRTYPVQIDGQALVLGIARDITERKKAEEALRAERDKLQALMDGITRAGIGIDIVDVDYRILFQNKTLEQRFGKSHGEPCYKHYVAQQEPCDRCSVAEAIQQNAAVETEQRGHDGRDYQIFTAPVPEADGSVNKAIEIILDITERKRIEEALQESEGRFRGIFEDSIIGMYRTTPDGRILMANPALVRMLGYSCFEELAQRNLEEEGYGAQSHRSAFTEHIEAEGRIIGMEAGWAKKDSTILPIRESARAVRDELGNTLYYEGTVEDITERKRAERALHDSERFLQNVFDGIRDGISVLDRDLNIVRVNKWMEEMYGTETPLLGRKCYEVYQSRECLCPWCPSVRSIETGEVNTEVVPYPSAENPAGWIELSAFPLKDADGSVVGVIEHVKDVTERIQTEERKRLATQVLELLNRSGEKANIIHDILLMIREFTGFEAIGIRLKKGEDFPYYETSGFPAEFIQAENYLCACGPNGELMRDSKGEPLLECMCGNVICGRADPSLSFFTEGGSFWTNSTTELLASTDEKQRQSRTRNRCNSSGYESVALIPLYADGETIGLLQLNDSRKDMFTLEKIRFFEEVGASIGITFKRKNAEEALREAHEQLEQRVRDRTAELEQSNKSLQTEIAERKRAEEQLTVFRKFAEASEQALGMADLEGCITYANPTLCRVLGAQKPEDICGTNVADYYSEEDLPTLQNDILPAVVESGHQVVEMPLLSPEGKSTPSIQSVFLIRDDQGKPFRIANVITDITERKRAEEELRKHRDHLEEMVAERTSELERRHQQLQRQFTERKRIEDRLRKSEQRYRAIVEDQTELICRNLPNGAITFVNDAYCRYFGKSRDELVGQKFMPLIPEEDHQKVKEHFASLGAGNPVATHEHHVIMPNGEIRWHQWTNRAIFDDAGNIVEFQGAGRDITKRKLAEEELRENEQRFRSLSEAAFEGIAITERGVVVDVNDAFLKMYGCNLEEIKGKQVMEMVAPEYRELVLEKIRSGYEGVYEHKGIRKDGSLIDLEIQGRNIIYQGRNMRLTAIRDITERKRLEEAYHSLVDQSIQGLTIIQDGRTVFLNKAFSSTTGYSMEDMSTASREQLRAFVHPDDREMVWARHRDRLAGKPVPAHYEFRWIRKDGSTCWVEIHASKIEYQGRPAIQAAYVDITDRKQAEEKLRESEERLTKAFRASPNLMGIIDLDEQRRLLVNEAFARVTGYSIEEVTGTTSDELNFWVEPDKIHEAFRFIKQDDGILHDYETDIRTKHGEIRTLAYNAALLDIPGKNFVAFSAEDITEQKEAERRIKKYQTQLKSLASELSLAEERERRRIAVGIHDDIAQKLAMAKFELQSLQASVTDTDVSGSLEKQCQLMDQVVADARSLTFELSNPVLYQVGLGAAVESYLAEQIQGQFGIKCKFKSEGPDSSLKEDIRVVLFQAVRELLANVVKHASASMIEVCISKTEDRLRIVVQDDGVGFDTTEIGPHSVEKGGFGLFNIRERLEYLGGNVKIESKRKKGARVTMTVAMRTDAAAE